MSSTTTVVDGGTIISSTTPEYVIVFGVIAATIQVIRLCIALIEKASAAQNNIISTSTNTAPTITATTTAAAISTSTSTYGSIGEKSNGTKSKENNGNGNVITITDGTISNNNNDVELQSLLPINTSSPVVLASSTTTSYFSNRFLFESLWGIFLFIFTVIWMVKLLRIYGTANNYLFLQQQSKISNIVYGLVSWTCGLQCIYTVYTTYYQLHQRIFHILSSFFIWSCVVLQILYQIHHHTSTDTTNKIIWFDWLYIGIITTYVLCTILQGYVMRPSITIKTTKKESSSSSFQMATLKPLLKPYFWPDATSSTAIQNRFRAILTWVCVIVSKICNLISPLYLGWASTSLAHGQYYDTMKYSVLYSIISWIGTTLKECQSLIYLKVAQAAYVQLSETAFEHLHSLSLDWHLRKKLGEVIRSMDRGIAACDTLMKYLFLWLAPALAECIAVCIIFATYFHYLPLAITVFYFVLVYVVCTVLVTVWRKQYRKALTKSDNEWHDRFTDSLINFETVKFFTAEQYEKQRFKDAVITYQAGSVDVQASLSFLNISQQIILKLCLAVSLSLSVLAIHQRITCCTTIGGCDSTSYITDCCRTSQVCANVGMQIGDFVAVLTYTINLFAPLNFLGTVYNAVVMAMIDLTNMSELLSENPDVVDSPTAVSLVPSTTLSNKDDIVIEFDNVYFHYPTQPETRGLKGLSFQMKRGTTTAIVGPTGAGKTTVSRLLFRFYDVLGGAVKIHGRDVRSVTQESLRGMIGVVPQVASMFNDTIRSNLLYGRRDATDDELKQAAQDAQILPFIESLDDGWNTMVGDRGLKLSGGERQRAAIARCLLKDPPIVLLDEATSALDTITEMSVQQALDRLGTDRTVLVIAHRLGTIRNADNIIVLKDGVAAEQGTHDELLIQNGIYAEMWNMQLHSATNSTRASRDDLLLES